MPNPEPINGRGAPVLEPGRGATPPQTDPIPRSIAAVVRAAFPLARPSEALRARVAESCRMLDPEPRGRRSGPPPQAPTAVAAPGGGGPPPRRVQSPWLRLFLTLLMLAMLAMLASWVTSRIAGLPGG
jgi:hypothetical protein